MQVPEMLYIMLFNMNFKYHHSALNITQTISPELFYFAHQLALTVFPYIIICMYNQFLYSFQDIIQGMYNNNSSSTFKESIRFSFETIKKTLKKLSWIIAIKKNSYSHNDYLFQRDSIASFHGSWGTFLVNEHHMRIITGEEVSRVHQNKTIGAAY